MTDDYDIYCEKHDMNHTKKIPCSSCEGNKEERQRILKILFGKCDKSLVNKQHEWIYNLNRYVCNYCFMNLRQRIEAKTS